MSELMIGAKKYFSGILGVEINFEKVYFSTILPAYFSRRYNLYKCIVINTEFLVLASNYDEDLTVKMLKKRLELISKSTDEIMPVVFLTNKIDWYTRKSFVKEKISFVIPDKQLYIPFLGMVFMENHSLYKQSLSGFSPATQFLFFCLIDMQNNRFTLSILENRLTISRMSVYRGLEELVEVGLLRREKIGKEVIWSREVSISKMWEFSKKYLINPIQSKVYVVYESENKINNSSFVIAGESALSKYTLITEPHNITYAVYYKEWVKMKEEFDIIKYPSENTICIEVWKHIPPAKNGIVHPLTLLLTQKDEEDERVQIGLEDILNNYNWKEN